MADLEDDEVPPLEDMTETINRLAIEKSRQKEDKKLHYLEPISNEVAEKNKNIIKMLGKEEEEELNGNGNKIASSKNTCKDDVNFCGFKKGFLTGDTKSSSNKTTNSKGKQKSSDVIQCDVVKNNKAKTNENVIPEVQDALKTQIPLLQSNDWLTEDLLEKIMKHPKFSKQFMDPRFSQDIAKFQSNPKEVMERCSTNEELREFIQEFCALMGDHFTALGDKQDKKSPPTNKMVNNTNQEDSEKIQRILSDPEISKILASTRVQQLFTLLRSDPDKAQRMLHTADGDFRYHIQKLIDAGLLQFAR